MPTRSRWKPLNRMETYCIPVFSCAPEEKMTNDFTYSPLHLEIRASHHFLHGYSVWEIYILFPSLPCHRMYKKKKNVCGCFVTLLHDFWSCLFNSRFFTANARLMALAPRKIFFFVGMINCPEHWSQHFSIVFSDIR